MPPTVKVIPRLHVTKLIFHQDAKREWRYKAMASNGRCVGRSEEGFKRFSYAKSRALKQYPGGVVLIEGQ